MIKFFPNVKTFPYFLREKNNTAAMIYSTSKFKKRLITEFRDLKLIFNDIRVISQFSAA